jgi:choloylglycine hydrolase
MLLIRVVKLIIVIFSIFYIFIDSLLGCTAFCIKGSDGIVLCKNLDWDLDNGIICINKKNILKTAFLTNNDVPVKWISKYGSVTFNHIGKEFPLGGLNEHGLAIEELNYYWTRYPDPDERASLNELQWIQYQLDNFSTVDQVIKSDSLLRISRYLFNIHFLVCDKSGDVATIEFLKGKMIYHKIDKIEVAVLTNHNYDESIAKLKNYQGFGGNMVISQKYGSLNNFIRASSLIRNYSDNFSLIDYSFNILASVANENDTQWQIVYDLSNLKIYFKTRKHNQLKWIDLKEFDYNCNAKSLTIDINTSSVGDITEKFTFYNTALNREHIYNLFDDFLKLDIIDDGPEKDQLDKLAKYPETLDCIEK